MRHSGERIAQHVVVVIFVITVFVVLAAQMLIPDETTSLLERRDLAEPPTWTVAALKDGSYFGGWETYLSEQMPWREQWVQLYSGFRLKVLGRQYINGVYFGSDGYLLNGPQLAPGPDIGEQIESAAARLAELNQRVESYGGRFVYLHVPDKQMIYRKHYPWYVEWPEGFDEVDVELIDLLEAEGVPAIDLRSEFLERTSEELFYRTDHHWTFDGAYLGYTRLVEHFGLTPYSLDDLDVTRLPNPFVGSHNRRIGMAVTATDRLAFATPRVPVPYTMTVPGGEPVPMFAMPEDPSEPVDYLAFMGGDLGEVIIDTNRPELPDALLVGTSFTNAIEPLLYLNFDQLRILDLRAYHEMSVHDYVAAHQPDCVMLLVSSHEILVDEGNAHFGEPVAGTTSAE
ncbi:MAG: hypothetical protein JW733_05045 [Coriobacteriia bacterium]|nr:hypothetical protein [Coriobacteriia bacterium]MBN2847317.1 hypothetical protein [Coriobacteriia bacterium]